MSVHVLDASAMDECTSGLVGYAGEWLEFVHGTAIEIFDAASGIQANGGGDYGAGCYTFLVKFETSSCDKLVLNRIETNLDCV